MAAPYVTVAELQALVFDTSTPTANQTAWMTTCVAAIEGAIAHRLEDGAFTPSSSQDAQLQAAAVIDAAALYKSREAPHGVLSIGPDGDVARLGSAVLRACEPILYAINPGIG